jgi:hypothetical protein
MPTTQLTEPTVGETLDETLPVVGVVPVHGPAAILVAGPWVLIALLLTGPFALLFTLVALLAAAAAVVALIGAVLAAPFVLVRRVRRHRAAREPMRAPATQLVPAASQWRAA